MNGKGACLQFNRVGMQRKRFGKDRLPLFLYGLKPDSIFESEFAEKRR